MPNRRQTMTAILDAKDRDLTETEYFSGIQIKLWRALAIILAHHPELATQSIRWMALNCWLSGDKHILEKAVVLWTVQAKKCGVAAGIFEKDTVWSDDTGLHRKLVESCSGKLPHLNPVTHQVKPE